MKRLASILFCVPAFAAITGVVHNGTTGQPQAATTVGFYTFGQAGMEKAAEAKTGAQGDFSIDRAAAAQGPSMIRVEVDGVTYNQMIPPGAPTTGLQMTVYNASRQPGAAKVGKHMILFQPSGGQMLVTETYLYENAGKTTWFDPAAGTLRFYLPPAANGSVEVHGTAPDGMAVPVPSEKGSRADLYVAKFEVKPGETRFDLSYTVPYKEGEAYSGKIVTDDDNTYLVAPSGVTLTSAGLKDLGQEPRSQAHIFGLAATAYKVTLTGSAAAAPAQADAAAADDQASAGPQIEQMMPRIYRQAVPILALAFGILAVGFALLYRAPVPKETNERGRG